MQVSTNSSFLIPYFKNFKTSKLFKMVFNMRVVLLAGHHAKSKYTILLAEYLNQKRKLLSNYGLLVNLERLSSVSKNVF